MSKLQKIKTHAYIDYVPAELKENKDWRIVFKVKHPVTGKFITKRPRVKKLKSITERRKLAKKMELEINKRLAKGVTEFFTTKGNKELTLFKDVTNTYLNQIKREVKDGNLSTDTEKTYKSRINNFLKYIKEIGEDKFFCHQLDNDFIVEFLDYLRYEKGVSSRTRDNYFTFLTTLTLWMLKKKYLLSNPCEGISKIHKKKNEKIIIPKKEREKIFNYYKKNNINYLIFCMCCYYCLARRTELSKIKVEDVNLKNGTMFISAMDSKNNKSSHVTIPPPLICLLQQHILKAKKTDYLFSDDNYKPGKKRFKPNKSTSNWNRMRNKIGINKKIKWYYLKDTGIVDLIVAGVPLNSVRDQARHHSINQTNEYIPKSMKNADNYITTSGVNFI